MITPAAPPYLNSGKVSYLKKGGIRDNPDGTITLSPSETTASMITYRVGVSVGLPAER